VNSLGVLTGGATRSLERKSRGARRGTPFATPAGREGRAGDSSGSPYAIRMSRLRGREGSVQAFSSGRLLLLEVIPIQRQCKRRPSSRASTKTRSRKTINVLFSFFTRPRVPIHIFVGSDSTTQGKVRIDGHYESQEGHGGCNHGATAHERRPPKSFIANIPKHTSVQCQDHEEARGRTYIGY
jgi:hypothetical protein